MTVAALHLVDTAAEQPSGGIIYFAPTQHLDGFTVWSIAVIAIVALVGLIIAMTRLASALNHLAGAIDGPDDDGPPREPVALHVPVIGKVA